jgi:phasin family protein
MAKAEESELEAAAATAGAEKRAETGSAEPLQFPARPKCAANPAPAKRRKPATTRPHVAATPAAVSPDAPYIAFFKEIPMDMTASLKDAYDKTTAAAGEYGEFAKGNVEAFVESGKILAAGLQDLGNTFAADGKAAFETMAADARELASVKSTTDFFKLQTDLLRRNFGGALAYGSKTGEAMLKLTNEVIAPLSDRVTLAIDKARKAA